MAIRRLICWYDIETNVLIGEVDADQIALDHLQQLFEIPTEPSDIWQSCAINQQQACRLSEWINIAFDFDQFIYQLDCCPLLKVEDRSSSK